MRDFGALCCEPHPFGKQQEVPPTNIVTQRRGACVAMRLGAERNRLRKNRTPYGKWFENAKKDPKNDPERLRQI